MLGSLVVFSAILLFLASRGKWSDAIIDSGREWIVPDALARGDLLYRDIVYWFGPFTPYFHAAFFDLFGSGYATLVAAGLVGSLGVLAALFCGLRTVTGRREAALWTALAVPVLVFMPNAGGPILGMGYRIWHAGAFAVAAIAIAARPADRHRPVFRAAAVGVLCALAGLCRTEWGLVALTASVLAILLGEPAGTRWRDGLAAGAAYLALFGGTIAAFVGIAGWKAVIEDGHVLLTDLPPETRAFLLAFSGVRDWRNGVLELLYSAAMWGGAFLVLQILAIGGSDRRRVLRKLPMLASIFVLLGITALLGGAGGAVLFSAAPLLCIGAAAVGVTRMMPSSAGLFAFGVAGAVLSYRRPFHIGDAAYVGPPLLFAFISAAGLVQRVLDSEDGVTRRRLRAYAAGAVVALVGFAFVGRLLGYRGDERIPIPGTAGMLSARAELVGAYEALARRIQRETRPGDTLVVFPEGELLNHLARRRNPMRYKLYIPGYLTTENEPEVLADLQRSTPAAVVICTRQTSEYGPGDFGTDYGRTIYGWLTSNYDETRMGRRPRCRLLLARKANDADRPSADRKRER